MLAGIHAWKRECAPFCVRTPLSVKRVVGDKRTGISRALEERRKDAGTDESGRRKTVIMVDGKGKKKTYDDSYHTQAEAGRTAIPPSPHFDAPRTHCTRRAPRTAHTHAHAPRTTHSFGRSAPGRCVCWAPGWTASNGAARPRCPLPLC